MERLANHSLERLDGPAQKESRAALRRYEDVLIQDGSCFLVDTELSHGHRSAAATEYFRLKDHHGTSLLMARFIALLRGINVSGKNIIKMADLKQLVTDLGWQDVETYIQSGNLVFSSTDTAKKLEATLKKAIADQFGFDVPTMIRSKKVFQGYISENPFPEQSLEEANRVMAAFSAVSPEASMATELESLGKGHEQASVNGSLLWIYYASGSGRSKLTPAVLERVVGGRVTTRNWKTIARIADML